MIGLAVSSCAARCAKRDISAAFREGGMVAAMLDDLDKTKNVTPIVSEQRKIREFCCLL